MILAYDSFQNINIFRITYLNDKVSASLFFFLIPGNDI